MIYGVYKKSRNGAWQCLIDFQVDSLPVKVSDIVKKSGITLLKNSDVNILQELQSGLTVFQNGKFYIVYRDTDSTSRCRFTIAHELGHIFLGHLLINTPIYRTFAGTNDDEAAANIFARDLLAPACVLHELHISKSKDIARLCNISMQSAMIREERMQLLENRNAWYLHPLERQVYKRFENFIKENLSKTGTL